MFSDAFQCPSDLVYLKLYNSETGRCIKKRQIAFFSVLNGLSSELCVMSVQYTGGCSVHWGISLSTLGGVQYTGGYNEYTEGCSIQWGIP